MAFAIIEDCGDGHDFPPGSASAAHPAMVARIPLMLPQVVLRRCDQLVTDILSPNRVMVKRRCFQPERKKSPRIRRERNRTLVFPFRGPHQGALQMDAIIYLVGLVVVIMFILSFFGLH